MYSLGDAATAEAAVGPYSEVWLLSGDQGRATGGGVEDKRQIRTETVRAALPRYPQV